MQEILATGTFKETVTFQNAWLIFMGYINMRVYLCLCGLCVRVCVCVCARVSMKRLLIVKDAVGAVSFVVTIGSYGSVRNR